MRLVSFASILLLLLLIGCQTTAPSDSSSGPLLLIPDVGQGHGVALVEGKRAVVVDAGPQEQNALEDALRAQGIQEIELLVLTHPDLDHFGGMDSLKVPLRGVLHGAVSRQDSARALSHCRAYPDGCRRAVAFQELRVLDDVTLRILGPADTSLSSETNANSLAIEFRWGNRSIFVASGDLDTLGELALLDRLETTEVVQLGHHGSKSSSHLRWLGAMMPRYAVVQAGQGNPYGHPTAEALARVMAVGAEVLRPDGKCLRVAFLPRATILD
jgi:competence protein ComEC